MIVGTKGLAKGPTTILAKLYKNVLNCNDHRSPDIPGNMIKRNVYRRQLFSAQLLPDHLQHLLHGIFQREAIGIH